MPGTLDGLFLETSIQQLRQYQSRIGTCLELLNQEQVWARGGGNENAIGNLVLHLCGNVRQWIVSGVGGRPDHRERDAEFAARGGVSIDELEMRLKAVVSEAADVLGAVTAARLPERVVIQGYDLTVLEAIYHVVEHFSMHTGQIIFATKMITGNDLGFYRHLSGAGQEPYPTSVASSAAGRRTPTKNDPNSA
jgi:uncharacterized damage-inducible protein DinB